MEFTGELWRHPGKGGWVFVTLPADLADEIGARFAHRPFGSVGVRARIGGTRWETSLFADTRRASYLLPVKADVRRRERIDDGDVVTVGLEIA